MASLKTLTIWSEGQLAKLVRENLKDRIFSCGLVERRRIEISEVKSFESILMFSLVGISAASPLSILLEAMILYFDILTASNH